MLVYTDMFLIQNGSNVIQTKSFYSKDNSLWISIYVEITGTQGLG